MIEEQISKPTKIISIGLVVFTAIYFLVTGFAFNVSTTDKFYSFCALLLGLNWIVSYFMKKTFFLGGSFIETTHEVYPIFKYLLLGLGIFCLWEGYVLSVNE